MLYKKGGSKETSIHDIYLIYQQDIACFSLSLVEAAWAGNSSVGQVMAATPTCSTGIFACTPKLLRFHHSGSKTAEAPPFWL